MKKYKISIKSKFSIDDEGTELFKLRSSYTTDDDIGFNSPNFADKFINEKFPVLLNWSNSSAELTVYKDGRFLKMFSYFNGHYAKLDDKKASTYSDDVMSPEEIDDFFDNLI